jgi:hypothetical protein
MMAGVVAIGLVCSGSARAEAAAESSAFASSSWLSVSRGPGTESCPTREQLAAAVAARLTSAAAPPSEQLSVQVSLLAREGALRAWVELRQRGQPIGVRQLVSRHASCVELAHALAIVVALAIDVHSAEPPEDAPATPLAAPPDEPKESADDDGPEDEFLPLPADASSELSADTSLRFGGEFTVGLMPRAQAGVGVALSHRLGSLVELQLGLSAFPWSVTSSLPNQRAEIDYRAGLGQALLCLPVAESLEARAALCAGISGGAMHTVSRGLGAARPNLSPLLNGVLSATLRFRLDEHWLGFFSAGLDLPWLRKEFVYSALDGTTPTAYRMPPQFGSFGIGFEYELGIRSHHSQTSRESAIHF